MPFTDYPFDFGLVQRAMSGLGVTQTGLLELTVAPGKIDLYEQGRAEALASPFVHTVVPSATEEKTLVIYLAAAKSSVQCVALEWAASEPTPEVPSGFEPLVGLVWGRIPARTTDLSTVDLYRQRPGAKG